MPDEALDPGFFDLAAWAETEAARLAGTPVTKTVRVDGVTEERRLAEVDWAQELAPFAQSSIDRPALWDAYAADSSRAGGLTTLRYRALDSSLFTREVVVELDAARRVRVVRIDNRFDSYVADTRQRLRYGPRGYAVYSRQDARLMEPRELEIEVNWE